MHFSDPPGPPEIHMYNEGDTIRMGQTVTLTCISHGGNPLAQIFWFKNGDQVDMSFTTSGRQSRNAYTFVATADDNNARFRCEAKNEMNRDGVPMTAEVVIGVQFAPEAVVVTGPATAKVGDKLLVAAAGVAFVVGKSVLSI